MQFLSDSFGMLTLSLFPLETHVVKSSSHMKRSQVAAVISAEPSPGAKHNEDDSGPSCLSPPTIQLRPPDIMRQRQTFPAVPSLNSSPTESMSIIVYVVSYY